MTAAEEIALIDEQLRQLYAAGVEAYSIGNRSVTKMKIETLTARKDKLLIRAQRETGSGGISLGKLTRGGR